MFFNYFLLLLLLALPYFIFYHRRGSKPGHVKTQTVYEWLKSFGIPANISDWEQKIKEYGTVFYSQILGLPVLNLIGMDAMEFLTKEEKAGKVENCWPDSTVKMMGETAMIAASGANHARLRKLNSNIFKPNSVAAYLPKVERVVKDYLSGFSGQKVELTAAIQGLTSKVALCCLFGVDESKVSEWDSFYEDFKLWKEGVFCLPINLIGFQYYKSLQARERMVNFLINYVKSEIRIYEESGKREEFKTPLVSLSEATDDDGKTMTEIDLANQALTIFFAGMWVFNVGHDTSSSVMISLIDNLSSNKFLLQEARAEQESLNLGSKRLDTQDLSNMVYLEACINEQLRLQTPVPAVFKIAKDDLVFQDQIIEKGTILIPVLAATQMLMGVKEAPMETFEPKRWLGMEISKGYQTKYNFKAGHYTWGYGKHQCLGKSFAKMEMKVILSTLIRGLDFEKVVEGRIRYATFPKLLFPVDPFVIEFKTRQKLDTLGKEE